MWCAGRRIDFRHGARYIPPVMTSTSAHPNAAKGKVVRKDGATIVFQPAGTSYELHVSPAGGAYNGPVDTPVFATIRVNARKVYSVPSGGNFVQPIFGQPRVIQGRVKHIEGNQVVIHAGVAIHVTLPAEDSAIDLANGGIAVGQMINVIALPGATAEF